MARYSPSHCDATRIVAVDLCQTSHLRTRHYSWHGWPVQVAIEAFGRRLAPWDKMMSTKSRVVLAVAIALGTTSASVSAPKHPVHLPDQRHQAVVNQPRGSVGSCNWGGYYANNQCVWYDVGDDDGGSHTNCKVCKNGRWFDLDQCERRCFK